MKPLRDKSNINLTEKKAIYVRLTILEELVSSPSLVDKVFVGLRNARILNLQVPVETVSDSMFGKEK
jgi:hypothetical protein